MDHFRRYDAVGGATFVIMLLTKLEISNVREFIAGAPQIDKEQHFGRRGGTG
ncbi:MAG TPA: hypothetical protein VGL53_30670 [Bryobacteraceae bacterium]|jgi:hypothetical protein